MGLPALSSSLNPNPTMKHHSLIAAFAFLAIASSAKLTANPENPAPLYVAIFDFDDGEKTEQGTGSSTARLLSAHLSTDDSILLVERAELDKLLGEQELGLSGAAAANQSVATGKLAGAQVIITGRAFEASTSRFLTAKVINAETSRVYSEMVKYSDPKEFDTAIESLAGKISARIAAKRAEYLPAPDAYTTTVAQLKELLKDRPDRPTVSLHIPEQHLATAVPDPAVETEFAKVLGVLGFTVVKPGEPADLLVEGEAFSEFATRRGSFVACRARIEIKVTDTDGKLLLADRTSRGAVDLSEATAGKSALQAGGLELVDRMLRTWAK